jgi:hypothetical protein
MKKPDIGDNLFWILFWLIVLMGFILGKVL